jgi:hypothetical protein
MTATLGSLGGGTPPSPRLVFRSVSAPHARALVLAAIAIAVVVGCSAGSEDKARITADGVSIEVPSGWDGRIASRTWPLAGAVLVQLASFELPDGDDPGGNRARSAMGVDDVFVELGEGLRETDVPVPRGRIGPNERLSAFGGYFFVDRFFVERGRAFSLHITFRQRRPAKTLIPTINEALATLEIEPRAKPLQPAPDPAPRRVFAPVRLLPTPTHVLNQCRLAQARSSRPILCPARLPRPFIAWPRGRPPRLAAQRLPAPGVSWRSRSDPRYRNRTYSGVSIGYGAPWEPDSGPDWRIHLWRNRPCCFLHFEVFWRRPGARFAPAGARPATLGGRRGLLKDATSYGLASGANDYLYWANHTRFLWRENGVDYVASLHRFGTTQETRALLGRLVRELRRV